MNDHIHPTMQPFVGSITDTFAARRAANRRIADEAWAANPRMTVASDRELVELGLIAPGERVTDEQRRELSALHQGELLAWRDER